MFDKEELREPWPLLVFENLKDPRTLKDDSRALMIFESYREGVSTLWQLLVREENGRFSSCEFSH